MAEMTRAQAMRKIGMTSNQGGNGQDLEANPLGSILRIDIDNGDPYSVPADNPNLSSNFPETWAYGFRNPLPDGL